MTQILWLASFPKSGNTWLRAFLANYLADAREPVAINALPSFAHGDMRAEPYAEVAGRPFETLSAREINALRPQAHRRIAASGPGVIFVKTHAALGAIEGVATITPDVTFGAIHVVRSPLDVAPSFADHYGLPIDGGVRAVCLSGLAIEPKQNQVRQLVADWSTHARGWLDAEGLYRLTLRYEDMLADPTAAFARVVAYLKLPADPPRLARAIAHSSFETLAGQERTQGFVERSKNARAFFRTGRAGGWRETLSPAQVRTIVDRHRPMMERLGYLDSDGRPR